MELAQGGYQVFAVDVLGQGSSWPLRPPEPKDHLYISIDMWRSQLRDFAVDVMGVGGYEGGSAADSRAGNARSGHSHQIFVAGNSLGGLLAVYLAAQHPELVRGLILLNATPFWSFRPPLASPDQVI